MLEIVLQEHLKSHPHEPLIINKNSQRVYESQLTRLMDKFKAFFPLEGKDWGSHSLRHSFAYNFLKKGGEMYQLQALLGHRSIDVTVDLYGQLKAQDIECPSPYDNGNEDENKGVNERGGHQNEANPRDHPRDNE